MNNQEPVVTFAAVINDDTTQLAVISGLLRKAGVEPCTFNNAEDALLHLTSCAGNPDQESCTLPSLIVTDLYMPGLDGWHFCRLLRSPEYPSFNRIPIIVVSATFAGDEPDRIATDLGAEAFFSAPLEGAHFIEQVQAILQGKKMHIQPRALIVEEDPQLTDALGKEFAGNGYLTDAAKTCSEAIEKFSTNVYKTAVIAYHLPDRKGDCLLEIFAAGQPKCACIMMTADSQPELALHWMKRGAAAYLRKPFDPAYLVELCNRVSRERSLLLAQDLLEKRTRELRESEAQLRTITDSAQDAILLMDNHGTITYWNPAAEEILGYKAEEAIGKILHELLAPKRYFEEHNSAFPHFVSSGQGSAVGKTTELAAVRKDGREIAISLSVSSVLLKGAWHAVGILRDITDRKHSETALRESEERYRLIFEFSPLGLLYFDRNGVIVACNDNFISIIGSSREALIGLNMLELPDRELVAAVRKALEGRPGIYEGFYHSTTAEKITPARAIFAPLRSGDQSFRGGIGIVEDITDRIKAEEEREKLQTQLIQAQKMEAVGRLAGGVAHDFNNMLGVILGRTELALKHAETGGKLNAHLQEIKKAAERSADLTRQLLAFARKQTIVPKALALDKTVEGMLKMLQRLIGEQIDLVWQPTATIWQVKIDPSQLDQILANLCVNARDAIDGAGKITIRTQNAVLDEKFCNEHPGAVPGEFAMLSVSDNGCGMDRETIDRLFEPFFTTKETGKGTGLGLSTVYGIVKQNNGCIQVHSEHGQGTTFEIYLPRYKEKEEQLLETGQSRPTSRGSETILLVEDEPANLEMGEIMLKELGYNVLAAASPGEAIRLAETCPGEIDLLITDVIMPEMNGRDLARNILAMYPNIKRLFMSGYTADVIAQHGVLDAGVHFIQKPFTMKDLAEKIRTALGKN